GAGPADGGTTAAEETAELAAEGTEEPADDGSAADADAAGAADADSSADAAGAAEGGSTADAGGAADAGDAAGAEGAGAVPSREPRALETDALVQDLADRLHRLGLLVERDFGLSSDRIELA